MRQTASDGGDGIAQLHVLHMLLQAVGQFPYHFLAEAVPRLVLLVVDCPVGACVPLGPRQLRHSVLSQGLENLQTNPKRQRERERDTLRDTDTETQKYKEHGDTRRHTNTHRHRHARTHTRTHTHTLTVTHAHTRTHTLTQISIIA